MRLIYNIIIIALTVTISIATKGPMHCSTHTGGKDSAEFERRIAAELNRLRGCMISDDKVKFYTELLDKIQKDLTSQIPQLDETQKNIFLAACNGVKACKEARDAADAARNAIKDDDDAKAAANKVYDQCDKALTEASKVAKASSRPLLDDIEAKLDAMDQTLLAKCAILTHGTPKGIGGFASLSQENADLIEKLLADTDLMNDMLKADGAKNGRYGEAMQIYSKILSSSRNIDESLILHHLALGTALELAVPMTEFDLPDVKVDPLKRYQHYEDAFLAGELDTSFASRTVWECRMIIDSDAPNEQLAWGREMLRNYRPDEVLLDDMKWRYCRSVRTEVGYRGPAWTSTPRTYQQLISGGEFTDNFFSF